MSIKRYFASKDNSITNTFFSNLTTRATGSNVGLADSVEVFSIFAQANSSSNEQAKTLFSNGWSLMVYPQGTRAKKDNFLPFKSGAFHIALDNNIPILPVVIAGTGDIWPRGGKFMTSGKAIINTLEPIDISKYTKETIDQLVEETYEKMSNVYKELTASIK